MTTPKLSVCIPVYPRNDGLIEKFLTESFVILINQNFKDFNIIVSDQSSSNKILDLCENFSSLLKIKYVKNESKTPSLANNMNNALRNADGEIVKILFQDDFLIRYDALEKIVQGFENSAKKWLLTGFTHCNSDRSKFFDTRIPWFGNKYVNGDNTTGNPSTYAVKREFVVEMDENLKFLVDGELFYRTYFLHGDPIIINEILVSFREHEHSSFDKPEFYNLLEKEKQYCVEKYKNLCK